VLSSGMTRVILSTLTSIKWASPRPYRNRGYAGVQGGIRLRGMILLATDEFHSSPPAAIRLEQAVLFMAGGILPFRE